MAVDTRRHTEESIRAQVKDWLDENFSTEITVQEWLERLADSGWASPTWPEEWYGKGLSNDLAAIVIEEFRKLRAPGPPAGLSRMLAAPTIIAHGTDEQKRVWVREILTGEIAWCQLFSEPGAGSDLASLQTKAIRDGDEWIVNGQKVWTSGAQGADVGMLIARTNPDAPKHAGITYFRFDMDQPGVEVRPLRQMTGGASFCEVFFTDARVPHENIIGGLNDGWACALTTLANERVGLGGGGGIGALTPAPGGKRQAQARQVTVGEYIERTGAAMGGGRGRGAAGGGAGGGGGGGGRRGGDMVGLAKAFGKTDDPVLRQKIVQGFILSKVSQWNGLRAKAAVASGRRPGPEASLGKLMVSIITKHNRDLGPAILGAHGMLTGEDAPLNGAIAMQCLGAPAPSIYGGTDEIQHNIIGERVLGLPREPDTSKDVPFKDLKVGTQKA